MGLLMLKMLDVWGTTTRESIVILQSELCSLFSGLWGEESMGKEVALRINCRGDICMNQFRIRIEMSQ